MIEHINYNGITAEPSDYLCPDGDLSVCIGLAHEHGSLVPMVKPKEVAKLPEGATVIAVHKGASYHHYILKMPNGSLYWLDATAPVEPPTDMKVPISQGGEIYKVEPMGNTLIMLTDKGLAYILWRDLAYHYLGTGMPRLYLAFRLIDPPNKRHSTKLDVPLGAMSGRNAQDEYRLGEQIMGKVNEYVAGIHKSGRFLFPFFVRYAYRLYDGSLTRHSAPILITPRDQDPQIVPVLNVSGIKQPSAGRLDTSQADLTVLNDYKALGYKPIFKDASISDWHDIIKSIDIFVSAPIYTYDQAASAYWPQFDSPIEGGEAILSLPRFAPDKLRQEVMDRSTFYFLHSIKIEDIDAESDTKEIKIEPDYLTSLVAREAMTDDYSSHDTVIPRSSFVYNGRANLAQIQVKPFAGFPPSMFATKDEGEPSIVVSHIVVYLKTGHGDIVVHSHRIHRMDHDTRYRYFYYPNTKAYRAYIAKKDGDVTKYYPMELTPHEFLNGSVFFSWDGAGQYILELPTPETPNALGVIPHPSKIYTSEVNNPFFFPVSGINSVGSGQVIGISSTTKALSQGQFGQFPLYAFTTEGVWALEVTQTGTYRSKQPISRDVCINPDSITQIDGAVLFATDRGIMMISGSDVVSISDGIRGHRGVELPDGLGAYLRDTGRIVHSGQSARLEDFLKSCRMIYDYANARIIAYTPTLGHTDEPPYAYIYSLRSRQWSMAPYRFRTTINAYPSALALDQNWEIVDVSGGGQTEVFAGHMLAITRPIKIGQPSTLKAVSTLIQRGHFKRGHVKSILYGSRDLYNWAQINSSSDHIIRGFRGTGYKYFRIALICDLDADESIAGATIEYRLKQNDQPR